MHTEVCAARFKEENYANPVADLTDDSCNRMEKLLLLWTTVIPKFHNTQKFVYCSIATTSFFLRNQDVSLG